MFDINPAPGVRVPQGQLSLDRGFDLEEPRLSPLLDALVLILLSYLKEKLI